MHFNQVAKHHRPDVFWGARVNDAPGNNSNPSESLEICSATDHLTSMSGIVAASAIDTSHRKHLIRTNHRKTVVCHCKGVLNPD